MRYFFLKTFVTLAVVFCLCACQTKQTDAWDAFTTCATNACVEEVLAVKDAFLADPEAILTRFNESDTKGEDSVVGWLYILRDSVLLNPKFGSIEDRQALQQEIVATAQPYEENAKFKDMAGFVVREIGNLILDPGVLEGTWESLDDPKSVVKIGAGKYIDEYDGEEVSSADYTFYAQCPEDCNPMGEGACIKTTGEEAMCFTVVSVTAQNLELSLIGGRGNTNRYKRKE